VGEADLAAEDRAIALRAKSHMAFVFWNGRGTANFEGADVSVVSNGRSGDRHVD